MLAKIIDWSARNRFFVLLGTFFVIIWGVFAILRTPIDALPDLSDVQVIVYTEYPGQAPQVVEDQITYPLTTSMLSVPKSKVVRGFSFFGASFVYIIFEDGTDIYWARSRVLEYLNFAAGRMPKGVTPQIGPDATGVGWVMNAMNSQVNVVGGSYSRTYKDLPRYKDRPTLRVANNATLNVTNAEVTGTYCDVFVTGATANLFGGTYTNTNQYPGYMSPALKVWNGGTLSVNGATVECRGGNAAISSGEPAGSKHCYDQYDNGGKLVVENCTIKNSKYGIYLGPDSSTSAELKSATFENNESDIYLESDKEITISDTFTTQATIKVADPEEGRQLTVAGNANKLNLVGQNDYRVAYDKAQHYYYLTQRAPGYTLTAKDATATIKVGGVDTKVDPNDEIYEGTPVTLTADPAPDGQKFAGWTGIVILNGVVQNEMNDLLSFPNEEDHTTANFEMPKGNVTVRAVYEAVDPVEPPVDPVDPVDPVGPVDPVLPGVIIGGAVILGAYETGTGIYRLMNMQGLPLPSDRIELAELVWERAGKPEPQNMTDEDLYADIDAADTDAQKAAHWMVEQELMKFDEDNNKFHPCFPVSKLRVCLTWQNAKDKGLID